MPVKKTGIGLLNPVMYVNDKYLSYHIASTEFIRAMTGEGTLSNADHLLELREERRDGQKNGITSSTPNSKN